MRFRFAFAADGSPEDLISPENPEDQRARPRTGPIEKIADIAYDTLRKYEGELPADSNDEK